FSGLMLRALFITFCCVCAFATHAQSVSYMGLTWPPLPNGCKELGGAIVDRERKDRKTASTTRIDCGGGQMEWLAVEVKRDSRQIYWEVRDILQYLSTPEGYELNYIDCTLDKRGDVQLIVIAKFRAKGAGAVATHIAHAWLINIEHLKFERVSTKRVACGYDDDRD